MKMKAWERWGSRVSLMLAGILTCSLGATGYSQYATSEELKSQAEVSQAEVAMGGLGGKGGSAFEDQNGKDDQGRDNQGRDNQSQGDIRISATAETTRLETELTTAPLPVFGSVDDPVYVKTSDGDSVRIRPPCDTGSDSNITTYASHGTKLKHISESSEQTRADYNGTSCYLSSAYITIDVIETNGAAGVSGALCMDSGEVTLNPPWKYADFSKTNSGPAALYRSDTSGRKNTTVCVNAGHGTKGSSSVKTLCHPDGTPKVIGGITGAGTTSAVTVSGGTTFADDTAESKVTPATAKILKDKLLASGYDVLMIRESDDVQLDNIVRAVIANDTSDCHIALHWDLTTNNKGAFYMNVPNVDSYRNMEPVRNCWQPHNALGESLVVGLKGVGAKIFSNGAMAVDLTQTSFSTIPSVDIELGDKASDHSQATLNTLADGLLVGINQYFSR